MRTIGIVILAAIILSAHQNALANSMLDAPKLLAADNDIEFTNVTIDVTRDGSGIAFSARGNSGRLDLYMLNMKSMKVRRLTTTADDERLPSFSRDGTEIAFVRSRDIYSAGHICIMNLRTGVVRQLTFSDASDDEDPSFSDDGKLIVFIRNNYYGLLDNFATSPLWGKPEVYEVSLDGTQLRRLTVAADISSPFATGTQVFFVRNKLDILAMQGCVFAIGISRYGARKEIERFVLPSECLEAKACGSGKVMFVLYYSDSDPNFSKWTVNIRSVSGRGQLKQLAVYFGPFFTSAAVTGRGDVFFVGGKPSSFPSLWEKRVNDFAPHELADNLLFTQPTQWKPD